MKESNKISATRAHKMFQLLVKLELFNRVDIYDNVDQIYSAIKYAEKYEQTTKSKRP